MSTGISNIEGYTVGMLYRKQSNPQDIYMLTKILHAGRLKYDLIFRNVFDLEAVVSYRLDYDNIEGSVPLVINHFQVGDNFLHQFKRYEVIGFRPLKGSQKNRKKLIKIKCEGEESQTTIEDFLTNYELLYE